MADDDMYWHYWQGCDTKSIINDEKERHKDMNTSNKDIPSVASDTELLISSKGSTQFVCLNRPKNLNALTLGMVRVLTQRLKVWESDATTCAVVLKSLDKKAFCSGGDLKSIYNSAKEGGNHAQQFFYEEFSLNCLIGYYKKPCIPMMDGITFGGAAGVTMVSQLCVCSENAVFCMPECAIGFFTDVGSGHFLAKLPDNLGTFLGLTGHRLRGQDIIHAGLGSHFILAKYFPAIEEAFSDLLTPCVEEVKYILNHYQELSFQEHLASFSLRQQLDQIAACFRGSSVEEILELLRSDGSEWALTQVEKIMKMSPMSLKVSLQLLQESRPLSESLGVEYRLTQRFVGDHDFLEGIRAVIVDKDRNPKWNPSTLADVTQEKVDFYFSALTDVPELDLLQEYSS